MKQCKIQQNVEPLLDTDFFFCESLKCAQLTEASINFRLKEINHFKIALKLIILSFSIGKQTFQQRLNGKILWSQHETLRERTQ